MNLSHITYSNEKSHSLCQHLTSPEFFPQYKLFSVQTFSANCPHPIAATFCPREMPSVPLLPPTRDRSSEMAGDSYDTSHPSRPGPVPNTQLLSNKYGINCTYHFQRHLIGPDITHHRPPRMAVADWGSKGFELTWPHERMRRTIASSEGKEVGMRSFLLDLYEWLISLLFALTRWIDVTTIVSWQRDQGELLSEANWNFICPREVHKNQSRNSCVTLFMCCYWDPDTYFKLVLFC